MAGWWLGSAALAMSMEAEPPAIAVLGVGEVLVAPDEAVLTLGVRATARTADRAFDDAAERARAVVDALADLLPEERIRTSRLALSPRTTDDGGTVRLTGYEASALLALRVDVPADVGVILDASVAAGANEVGTVRWLVVDDAAARRDALDAAVADALANARQVAAGLGATVGAPLTVTVRAEEDGPPPLWMERADADGGRGAADMPVLAGEQLYRAEVEVRFRLE